MMDLIGMINRKVKIGKREVLVLDILMFLGLLMFGGMLRYTLRNYQSGDWKVFLEPWTKLLKENGFSILKIGYYNYTPAYMYVLWFITILPVDTMLGIKFVSCLFDFILAAAVAKIVTQAKPGANPLLAFGLVWLAPPVVSNSSMWAQCDAIYTAFVMLCLLYIIKGKSAKAMLFYGISFAIKLQSIFLRRY